MHYIKIFADCQTEKLIGLDLLTATFVPELGFLRFEAP